MPIVGHKKQIKYLDNILKSKEQMPHAFLFFGPDKIGKKMIAVEFIKSIQCKKSDRIGNYCNDCLACQQNDKVNADFLMIEPDFDEEGKIKEIGIGKIRILKEFISGHSIFNEFKIAIIDRADMMTHEAQNALLKVLEEPKGEKIIFLISPKSENLLETIVSRVYPIKFNFVSSEDASGMLSCFSQAENQNLSRILSIIDLRPGLIYDLLQNKELLESHNKIIDDFFWFASADMNERFNYIEKASKAKGFDIKKILEIWTQILRFALFQDARNYVLIEHSGIKEKIVNFAKKIDSKKIVYAVSLAQDIYFLAGATNVNQRLVFEILALAL